MSEIRDDSIVFRKTQNRAYRLIPISATVKEMLAGIQQRNSDFVYTSDTGDPYREPPASFKLIVDRRGLNVGCDPYHKITFHSLRHTAATHMAKYLYVRFLMDIFG